MIVKRFEHLRRARSKQKKRIGFDFGFRQVSDCRIDLTHIDTQLHKTDEIAHEEVARFANTRARNIQSSEHTLLIDCGKN